VTAKLGWVGSRLSGPSIGAAVAGFDDGPCLTFSTRDAGSGGGERDCGGVAGPFIMLAVREVLASGRPTVHVAADLGVHRQALSISPGCAKLFAHDRTRWAQRLHALLPGRDRLDGLGGGLDRLSG
jgi:hypothetical protein